MSNTSHRKAQITLPGLSFKERQVVYIKCLGEIKLSERSTEEQDGRKPAHVMKVLNLQDGLKYRLICPSLMVSSFADENEEYVGKCFEVVVTGQVLPGKNYKGVEVYMIDCEADYSKLPSTIEDDAE